MNILYSSNDKYTSIAGVSMISLLENNKEVQCIKIFFIDCGLHEDSKAILVKIVEKYGRRIEFIKLDELITDDLLNVPNKSYYGRLFGKHITDENKILYLDCDLIINDSLESLYEMDLGNYWIAGVQGPGASYECRQRIGFLEQFRYINTGVLLINLDIWRKESVEEQLVDFLNRHGEIPPYHDQNIINAVCFSHTLILEAEYNLLWSMICCKAKHICKLNKIQNYYSEEEIKKALESPKIIHFSNSIYGRPWNKHCKHPFRQIYNQYLMLSPWKDAEKQENSISVFRKFRNMLYRNAPSSVYYALHVIENYFIKMVFPKLSIKSLNNWLNSYMNGK